MPPTALALTLAQVLTANLSLPTTPAAPSKRAPLTPLLAPTHPPCILFPSPSHAVSLAFLAPSRYNRYVSALDFPHLPLRSSNWLIASLPSQLPLTPALLRDARAFLLRSWRLRALELCRPSPKDLAGSCKFAALFAQGIFGGQLRSNPEHDFVLLAGSVLDLTAAVGALRPRAYNYDRAHHLNSEHAASLRSTFPRVDAWLALFLSSHSS